MYDYDNYCTISTVLSNTQIYDFESIITKQNRRLNVIRYCVTV